jgi:hypothetical protein
MKNKYTILILAFLTFSCVHKKSSNIESFVFFNGYSVSIDSLNKVQFSLRKYLEYSPSESMRIARGPQRQYFYLDTLSKSFKSDPAPRFGLDQFYQGDCSKTLSDLIKHVSEITLSDTLYDCDNENCDYNFFNFKYADGSIKTIEFCSYCIPNEFQDLINAINERMESDSLSKINHFFVNSLVGHAQEYFFKKLPPPPLPSIDMNDFNPMKQK